MNARLNSLALGRWGESKVAIWFLHSGACVQPAYEVPEKANKGPQLFCLEGAYRSPDMLIIQKGGEQKYVEAKNKASWTWSHIHRRLETGCDLDKYEDYQKVAEVTGIPVWLYYLQRGEVVADAPTPRTGPRGLYAGEIRDLASRESHRFGNTIYFSHEYPTHSPALRLIASYEEVCGPSSLERANRVASSLMRPAESLRREVACQA